MGFATGPAVTVRSEEAFTCVGGVGAALGGGGGAAPACDGESDAPSMPESASAVSVARVRAVRAIAPEYTLPLGALTSRER